MICKGSVVNDIMVISDWYYKEIGVSHKKRKYVQIKCLKCGWIGEARLLAIEKGNTGQCRHCRKKGKRVNGNPQNTNIYEIHDDTTIIRTIKGDEFLIDTEDIDIAKTCCWAKSKAGYAVGQKDGKKVKLHRLIMKKYGAIDDNPDIMPDHVNKHRYDNRKNNLNVIPKYLNLQNHLLYKNNKTGYSGISIEPDGKYRVQISNTYIGRYETLEEAIKVRKDAEYEYFDYLPRAS